MFSLVEDDGNDHDLSGAAPASATNYKTVKLNTQSIQLCNKVSVKLNTDSTSAKIEINDISIEYRELHKRSG